MPVTTIEWRGDHIRMIDQTRLPLELVHLEIRDVDTLAEAIKSLRVRGAPAIGIAGAFGVLVGLQDFAGKDKAAFLEQLDKVSDFLVSTRPTAVNLSWALKRMRNTAHDHASEPVSVLKQLLKEEALFLFLLFHLYHL